MKSVVCFVIGISALLLCEGCNPASSKHAYTIASNSMEPTLFEGDTILADETYYATHPIADGNLIVFRHNDSVLIKRVSALPGETIESRDGVLIRNGRALKEPYARHSGDPSPQMQTFPARTVPAGEVFVTGDNRDYSLDSRLPEFGVVHTSDVLGILIYIKTSNHEMSGRHLK